jgi:hypothetical protein
MPTPTYDLIASTVLGSDTATVTFSSIPATYRDLILVFDGATTFDGTGILQLVLNSDTGDNYKYVEMSGSGSSADSGAGSNNQANIGSTSNTSRNLSVVQIMDYSATDKHKTILIRSDNSALNTRAKAIRWVSTSAINTIVAQTNATSFVSGSSFYLYGIVS